MRSKAIPAAVLVILASAVAGGFAGSQSANVTDRASARLNVYAAALAAIESEYVEPVERTDVVHGSIDGLLRTLDPHSAFFTKQEFDRMQERQTGRYFGIGISIVSVNGDVTVTSLFEGSPAYRAGIRRGDVIARVGAEDAKGWETEEVVKRVKGPKGTTVDISIRRPGVAKLIDLTVERDEIHIRTVRTAFMMAPGTGYVRLQDFSETTDDELGDALQKLTAAGMQRLLLDLRDNPGGPLDQAIAVANRFLKKNELIVYTRGRVPRSAEDYRATVEGGYVNVPMVVLVSRGSASASEIVAGAMQDHDRAIVVGETTFGKALVQSVYPLSSGAGLAVTTGRYYTPQGRLIQRPWDAAFDEYITYSLRDQEATREHKPSDLKYTVGGRKVYSGGGIEPDHFVPGPVEGFTPTRFSRLLMQRGAFVGFAEKFTKKGDTRPAAASAATYIVAPGWEVTDQMVAAFRDYLITQKVRVDDAALKVDEPFIRAMIHFEVDNDLFSFEEARRNLSKVDPQVQSALGYFEESRNLLVTTRASR
jgi:carboxyl-terminal processing protease